LQAEELVVYKNAGTAFGPATQHNNEHERDIFQRGGIEFVDFLIASSM
jgi:hypothetical protein